MKILAKKIEVTEKLLDQLLKKFCDGGSRNMSVADRNYIEWLCDNIGKKTLSERLDRLKANMHDNRRSMVSDVVAANKMTTRYLYTAPMPTAKIDNYHAHQLVVRDNYLQFMNLSNFIN